MRLPDIIRLRLRSIFSRSRVDHDLDEELQYHLERLTEQHLADGMPPRDAHAAALKAMGGLEQRKEDCRDARRINMLDNFLKDLRFALRQLRNHSAFSATAIFMLALGLCASVAIFAFVDAALLRPLPYKDPTRLLSVYERHDPCTFCNLSWPDYLDWKKQNTTLQSLNVYTGAGWAMSTPTGPTPVRGAQVSDGFFRTLGVAPALGRDFYAGEDTPGAPRTAILSHAGWQHWFGGDPKVLGRTVTLDSEPYSVVGVLPRDFHFAPVGNAEFWSPLQPTSSCSVRRGCHHLYGVGRLKEGVSPEAARANFVLIAAQLEKQYPDSNRDQGGNARLLSEMIVGDIRPILLVLLGGAGLLLLIACVNVVGLLLVRSESRKREMAVRTALGASTGRLVSQFITEAVLLIAAGGSLGLMAASWLMRLLVRFRSLQITNRTPFLTDLSLNSRVLTFAAAVALVSLVVFSLAPGWRLWSPQIRDGLAEGSRGSAGTVWRRLGSKLVILELATAMVLLVGAGLLGKSLYRLLQVDLGFRPDHIVTLQVAAPNARYKDDPQAIALARQILNRVESVPGVKSAGIASNGMPLGGNGNTIWIRVLGRPWHGEHLDTPYRPVSPNYFTTLGARLLRGRQFEEAEDGTKPKVAIVNQAFVRAHFPNEDPLGREVSRISVNPAPIIIVGVVEDIREGPLDDAIPPVIYLAFNQETDTYLNLVVRTTQDERSLIRTLSSAITGIDSGIVIFEAKTMDARIQESASAYLHRATAWLVGGFAALALLMSLVGLYGVIEYSVSQRTREIGVRMALGAVPGSVYRLILTEAGWLTVMGLVAGLACSMALANLIQSLLFGVSPWDAPTLAIIAGLLAIAAMAASFLPARRAAGVNPVEALRAE